MTVEKTTENGNTLLGETGMIKECGLENSQHLKQPCPTCQISRLMKFDSQEEKKGIPFA